jgi:radical SAM superfamily enzyme YgiQ (UPF0313 family)
VVWSYSLADPRIRERFEATDWIWQRESLDEVSQQLAQNDIVTFSTYIWNHRYNYELARQIRAINPDTLIVFGGPEVAITDPNLFIDNPFMDLVICYEGEITFKRVLKAYESKDWESVPGLLINRDGKAVQTQDAERIESLEEVPSPYLSGMFDQMI